MIPRRGYLRLKWYLSTAECAEIASACFSSLPQPSLCLGTARCGPHKPKGQTAALGRFSTTYAALSTHWHEALQEGNPGAQLSLSSRSTARAAKPSLLPTVSHSDQAFGACHPAFHNPHKGFGSRNGQRFREVIFQHHAQNWFAQTRISSRWLPQHRPPWLPTKCRWAAPPQWARQKTRSKVQAGEWFKGVELLSYGSRSFCCCQYLEVFFLKL